MYKKSFEKKIFDKIADEGTYEPYSNEKYLKVLEKSGILKENKGKILELGCGSGAFGRRLGKNSNVIGIDVSSKLILVGYRANKEMMFVIGDVYNLPFKNNGFDHVFSGDFLHHVHSDLEKIFENVQSVLKNGGKFFAYEPNGDDLYTNLFYRLGFAATGNERAISPRKVTKILQQLNFANIVIEATTIKENGKIKTKSGVRLKEIVREKGILFAFTKIVKYIVLKGFSIIYSRKFSHGDSLLIYASKK